MDDSEKAYGLVVMPVQSIKAIDDLKSRKRSIASTARRRRPNAWAKDGRKQKSAAVFAARLSVYRAKTLRKRLSMNRKE